MPEVHLAHIFRFQAPTEIMEQHQFTLKVLELLTRKCVQTTLCNDTLTVITI